MQKGIITRLLDGKGFGFITSADEKESDLFFHANELQDTQFSDLLPGDHVQFEIVKGLKGQDAINISRDRLQLNEAICIEEDLRIATEEFSSRLAVIIAKNPKALESIEWRDLERLVAEVFLGIGFDDVMLTPSSKDGGKDVVLTFTVSSETRSYVIEIKHWRSGNRVGNVAISEFLHVIARENRNGGLFLATSGYCDNAFQNLTEIDRHKIRFGTKKKVVSLCRKYVRAREGIWSPPCQLETLIFEDTI